MLEPEKSRAENPRPRMEHVMIQSKPVAAMLALVAMTAGGGAQPQTTTRTITVAPIETVITQDASGNTLVTRRPLQSAPAPMTFTPPPLDTLVTGPVDPSATFVPPPQRTPPPAVAQSETRRDVVRAAPRPATRQAIRKVGQHARPAAPQRVHVARAPQRVHLARAPLRVHLARRPVRAGGPTRLASAPVLDAVQRQYIYRAIVEQQRFASGGALSFAPVVAQTEIVVPSEARRPVSTVIGSRLPATVSLIAVPGAASEHMRWLARYGYAIVNNRVLLVDPETSVVVADLTQ
jgi:uncharacterized protein DUF1236